MSYLLHLLLRRVGIRISELRIRTIYDRHPMPHSIRSLSDTLEELRIPCKVCRMEFGEFRNIREAFIAVAGDREFPFFLVETWNDAAQIVRLREVSGRTVVLTYEQFREIWSGTVLMIERGERPQQETRAVYYFRQWLAFMDKTNRYWLLGLAVAVGCRIALPAPGIVDLVLGGIVLLSAVFLARQAVRMTRKYRETDSLKYKHERLLESPEAFWHLLSLEPRMEADSGDAVPVTNYVDSDHTLTLIMNPSCPQCAKVHRAISSLQAWRIDLVFIVNEGDARSYDAALRMVSSGIRDPWAETDRIIAGWYADRAFPPKTEVHPQAKSDLEAQIAYCRRIGITKAPTVLVDNRRLPAPYDAEDLRYVL